MGLRQVYSVVQVTGTGDSQSTNTDGLTGLLWSPTVSEIIAEYIKNMSGTVLENVESDAEFVGLTFEDGQ